MKRFVVLLSVLFPMLSFSQRLNVNLFGGFSNYLGDLQQKSVTLEQSNRALGIGMSYSINRHLALRAGFASGKVKADDKLNRSAALQARNLNFQTVIREGHLLAEYTFLDMKIRKASPYVFGGVALYHFNPFTYDTLGARINLRPLNTEGQGQAEYPDRKQYKLTQFAIPFGAGVKYRLTDNVVVAYELGMRKLFTDHLDDVSTTYADETLLAAANGATAVQMAYRGGELKNGSTTYPTAAIRGNPKLKDWYYMHGLTISIGLNTGRGARSRVDCPKVD